MAALCSSIDLPVRDECASVEDVRTPEASASTVQRLADAQLYSGSPACSANPSTVRASQSRRPSDPLNHGMGTAPPCPRRQTLLRSTRQLHRFDLQSLHWLLRDGESSVCHGCPFAVEATSPLLPADERPPAIRFLARWRSAQATELDAHVRRISRVPEWQPSSGRFPGSGQEAPGALFAMSPLPW